MSEPGFSAKIADFEEPRSLLEQVCSQVAQHFSVYGQNGKPRKAKIIDALSRSSCPSCIAKDLSRQAAPNGVDTLYAECHMLAVNVLVEELCNFLRTMGFNVMISTEAELEYEKADIAITITRYDIDLKCHENELMVEVKTGKSLPLSQLFRYLLQDSHSAIVVWNRKRRLIFFLLKHSFKLI